MIGFIEFHQLMVACSPLLTLIWAVKCTKTVFNILLQFSYAAIQHGLNSTLTPYPVMLLCDSDS